MHDVTRIDRPDYAREPDIWLDAMRLSDYNEIQIHRADLLSLVDQEVAWYLNSPELVFESDDDGFPSWSRLTGEYYISDESYETHVGPLWYQIGINAHFLEKPQPRAQGPNQHDYDYLGLNVWIRCDPKIWKFSIFRNTDSSAI